jgi:hypothetical protein
MFRRQRWVSRSQHSVRGFAVGRFFNQMARFEATAGIYGRDGGTRGCCNGKTRCLYQVARLLVCLATAFAASDLAALFSKPRIYRSALQLGKPFTALLLARKVRADLSLVGGLPGFSCQQSVSAGKHHRGDLQKFRLPKRPDTGAIK